MMGFKERKALLVFIGMLYLLFVLSVMVSCPAFGDQLLYTENFDEGPTGWLVYSDDELDYGYESNSYLISVRQEQRIQWSWAPLTEWIPADFSASVTVETDAGPEGRYGLLWGIDDDNFYTFWVDNEGHYGMKHREDGEWKKPPIPSSTTSAVNEGIPNELAVAVDGSMIALVVNGEVVKVTNQPSMGPVGIGLVVETLEPSEEDQVAVSFQFGPFKMSGTSSTSEEEFEVRVRFDDLAVFSK